MRPRGRRRTRRKSTLRSSVSSKRGRNGKRPRRAGVTKGRSRRGILCAKGNPGDGAPLLPLPRSSLFPFQCASVSNGRPMRRMPGTRGRQPALRGGAFPAGLPAGRLRCLASLFQKERAWLLIYRRTDFDTRMCVRMFVRVFAAARWQIGRAHV